MSRATNNRQPYYTPKIHHQISFSKPEFYDVLITARTHKRSMILKKLNPECYRERTCSASRRGSARKTDGLWPIARDQRCSSRILNITAPLRYLRLVRLTVDSLLEEMFCCVNSYLKEVAMVAFLNSTSFFLISIFL